MEYLYRNHGHHLNSEKTADRIKVCKLLLDRLIKDEYYENTFKNHDKKWGKSVISYRPYSDELSELLISRPNAIAKKDKEKEMREFLRLCEHKRYLRKQDIDYLFKLMNKHVERWWD